MAQLAHIWPERRGTKWNRRRPFVPRREARPGGFRGRPVPPRGVGTRSGAGPRVSPVAQVAELTVCSGPRAQVHADAAAPAARPAPSHGEDARLREGKGTSPLQGRLSSGPRSRKRGHHAKGAPLRVPDARVQPPRARASPGSLVRATPGATREPRGLHVSTEGASAASAGQFPGPRRGPTWALRGLGGAPRARPRPRSQGARGGGGASL